VMKGFEPAFIGPSQVSRLKIRLVSTFDPNAVSPVTLSGVSFTDVLPTGLLFATPANATTNCTGSSISVDIPTQSITITGGNLAPGTQCDIEADVTAPLGSYNNVIPALEIVTNEGVTNQTATNATLTVVDSPTINKAFSPSSVRVGQSSTLTVTITNNAAIALTGVAVSDPLPDGMAVFSTPAASTTCAGGVVSALAGNDVVSLSGATIPVGGSCSFSVNVVGNASGVLTNSIGAGAISSAQGLSNPGPANAPLTILSPPGISKAFNPVSIASGGTSTLTIQLLNGNASALTLSSALVDALPGNVFVAAIPNVVKTCTGAVTAVAGATSITYANGASIPAGGCSISVDVTSAVSGAHTNTVAAGQLQTDAGNNPEPAVATLGVDQPAPPTVDKDFSPSTIDQDGISTLTITLGNPNVVDLTLDTLFEDTLPSGLILATPATVGGTCPGVVTAVAGSDSVAYANGAIIPAGGCTITVPVTSGSEGNYTNNIVIGALSTVEGGSNVAPVSANLVVRAPVPPSVGKSFAPGTINPGGISRLTILLDNANATSISLTADLVDTLPANVQIAATPNLGGTCPDAASAPALGSELTYLNGGSIPAGGCTLAVDVTSSVSGGPYINTIPAGALQTSVGNNGAPASANLFVNASQPPSVSKSFSTALIPAGGVATLSISLGNGNAVGTSLTADLVDSLPLGLVVANPPAIQASAGCSLGSVQASAGGISVTYASGGSILAGGCSFAVNVTSATAGSYTNTIAAGQLQTGIGNNAVGTSAVLQVLAVPTLSKSFSPTSILAGQTSTLTLTLGNANATTVLVLSSALTDTLPTGLVLANPATVGGTCTAGSVTAVAGSGSVSYASGATIPAAGGCTITVPVTTASGGSYVNTIAAGALQTQGGSNAAPTTDTLTVLGTPTVGKAFSPSSIVAGATSRLTLTLSNGNATQATLIADLVDTLPSGLTLDPAQTIDGTCTTANVTLTATSITYLSGAEIPAGGCTISVMVRAATIGTYVNTIVAGSLQTDQGTYPTDASAQLVVNPVSIPTLSEWGLLLLSLLTLLMVSPVYSNSRRTNSVPHAAPAPSRLAVFGHHIGEDAAAHVELGGQPHEARIGGPHQIVEDAVGDVLVEVAFLAERPHVQLEALQFDAALVRDVVQIQGGEVRLAGLRAQAGEFGDFHVDVVIPIRLGVVEGFQGFAWLAGHGAALKNVKIARRIINARPSATEPFLLPLRLKHIHIAGFKSFVDPVTFPPPPADRHRRPQRLRQVQRHRRGALGAGRIQGAELRGASMQDVIFNGSSGRKPASRASVELLFDNSDGKAAGQWSQYAEISVKRMLTRAGDSSYHINNVQVRKRDMADLFLGTGLGGEAYAIIEQGMISRIIEAKPEELRGFLEEAAGVSKYKERRKETESRLRDTRENLDRVADIREELGRQLEKLGPGGSGAAVLSCWMPTTASKPMAGADPQARGAGAAGGPGAADGSCPHRHRSQDRRTAPAGSGTGKPASEPVRAPRKTSIRRRRISIRKAAKWRGWSRNCAICTRPGTPGQRTVA
jgi:uncharacterized repeat protein (TIGR01451 family)